MALLSQTRPFPSKGLDFWIHRNVYIPNCYLYGMITCCPRWSVSPLNREMALLPPSSSIPQPGAGLLNLYKCLFTYMLPKMNEINAAPDDLYLLEQKWLFFPKFIHSPATSRTSESIETFIYLIVTFMKWKHAAPDVLYLVQTEKWYFTPKFIHSPARGRTFESI